MTWTRRQVLAAAAAALPARTDARAASPAVQAILAQALARDPASLNTDWFGTLLAQGLLAWGRHGVAAARPFVRRWFDHHLNSRQVAPFHGAKSRPVRAGGIPITTYCGHFGLAFPCFELARESGDARARRVCLDIAGIILHQAARNRFGMVAHDDTAAFAIPDTCFFAAVPLAMAAALDAERGWVFRDDAVYQLRTYVEHLLDRPKGLARTVLLASGPGKTYWTRASGWLLWALTGTLDHLPASDPAVPGFISDLKCLAEGVARVQDASGGLRVYLDNPASPLETSGTAMCAMCLHLAVRRNWLPAGYGAAAERAWRYVLGKVTPGGRVTGVYTGWAMPAEEGRISMDEVAMDWIPGLVLSAAAELEAYNRS